MPIKIPQEVKNYAKSLYMIPKPGMPSVHLYSATAIKHAIEEKFGMIISPYTVWSWINRKDRHTGKMWRDDYKEQVLTGYANNVYSRMVANEQKKLEVKQQDTPPEVRFLHDGRRKEYDDNTDIVRLERMLIKFFLKTYTNELQDLLRKKHNDANAINSKDLNSAIPKNIQQMILNDEQHRAKRLDDMRENIAANKATVDVEFSTLSDAELIELAKGDGNIDIDEHLLEEPEE